MTMTRVGLLSSLIFCVGLKVDGLWPFYKWIYANNMIVSTLGEVDKQQHFCNKLILFLET